MGNFIKRPLPCRKFKKLCKNMNKEHKSLSTEKSGG